MIVRSLYTPRVTSQSPSWVVIAKLRRCYANTLHLRVFWAGNLCQDWPMLNNAEKFRRACEHPAEMVIKCAHLYRDHSKNLLDCSLGQPFSKMSCKFIYIFQLFWVSHSSCSQTDKHSLLGEGNKSYTYPSTFSRNIREYHFMIKFTTETITVLAVL